MLEERINCWRMSASGRFRPILFCSTLLTTATIIIVRRNTPGAKKESYYYIFDYNRRISVLISLEAGTNTLCITSRLDNGTTVTYISHRVDGRRLASVSDK